MNCNSIRKLFVLFLTLFLSVQLFGQKDKYRLAEAPRWVKKIDSYHSAQPSQGQTEGYYYLLINHQKNIEEETNYSEYSVKVLNQSGIQEVSDIFLSFDPSYQEFIFHRFEIIRDGEIINKLNQSEIKVLQREENSERFLYDGRLSIGLNLTDVRVGDIIEYAYSKKGYNPVFEGKFSDKIYLEYSSPIDRYYYKVIANSLSGLNVQTHNGAQEPAISEMEGAITYTWNLKKLESKITDRNYPSWIDPYQFVEISEYESWGEVNNWALNYYSLNDKDKRTLKDLRSTEFKGGNQEEQIMKIIRFVQDEIRYLGFESGLNSHKPHSPIKVYNQRFGDCKDKSFLLSQLLQSIGVEAYPVLVNTVTTKSLNSVLPTPNAFDHCITQLRYKGTSHFIDPTIQNQGGTLSDYSSPNYHYGLVLKDGVKKLESIPVNENSETRVEEYFVLNGVGGVAEMYVNTVYSGSDADSQRSYFASSGLNNIQNNYLDYYSKLYPEIVIKNPIEFIDDRDQNKIVVTESYTINNFWIDNEQNEGQVYCEFYPLTLESYVNINKSLNRSLPYYISYPLNYHHKIKVDLPQEWNASSENLEIKSDSYHYNYSVTYSNEVLDINHSYRTFTDHIKSDDMREFKSDHDKILGN